MEETAWYLSLIVCKKPQKLKNHVMIRNGIEIIWFSDKAIGMNVEKENGAGERGGIE